MKTLFKSFIAVSFFAALPSFAASALPSGLPSNYLSWERPLLMVCAVRTQTGGIAEHGIELYNKNDSKEMQSVEIQRLNGEAYFVARFRSSPQLIGNGLTEIVFFVREGRRWTKHAFPRGITADTRREMFALAERVYLKPRGVTTAATRKCIRDGNE